MAVLSSLATGNFFFFWSLNETHTRQRSALFGGVNLNLRGFWELRPTFPINPEP